MHFSNRQLFLDHVAQTSPAPIGLEINKAKGCSMWSPDGKEYIDLISGFSVANIGHSHPAVIEAVTKQVNDYMHLMVYGEIIESPQVQYAKLLTTHLPETLNCVYFTNSGTEATEGAMKLAKRFTGRSEIVACNNAYHGSTQGALSIMGGEYWRNAYRPLLPGIHHVQFNDYQSLEIVHDECRPLLPGIHHVQFNDYQSLEIVSEKTACIILEVVQAEAGVIKANAAWLQALRQRCTETGTLLIFDEIQTGFGRTGSLWAFQQYGVVPDILLLGKALGGGMPLGAFIASKEIMQSLTANPVLGHISTFAGHPVCCAAGMAAFQVLTESHLPEGIRKKEKLFHSLLQHSAIKEVRSAGFLMAVQFHAAETGQKIVHQCVTNGLITDWFLFAPDCMRIAPPLIMDEKTIEKVCDIILKSIAEVMEQ